ncbi:MAG: shikimate kinase [Verrucomicrobiae bacterium]|nr:shikimate kinase [Verrucomicrobiae bacterium]
MKVAIIGNSGSGKSTLASRLAAGGAATILDLDLVFWEPDTHIERPRAQRIDEVQRFCREHDSWIIEGCYTDLIEASFPWAPELILLDPGPEVCISNCRRRPHEPHKFRTREEQDQRLDFLIGWVSDYYHRDGPMSDRSHKSLFDRYEGPKRRIQRQEPAEQGDAPYSNTCNTTSCAPANPDSASGPRGQDRSAKGI